MPDETLMTVKDVMCNEVMNLPQRDVSRQWYIVQPSDEARCLNTNMDLCIVRRKAIC